MCNAGRNLSLRYDELGSYAVPYCFITFDNDGYPIFEALTPSGIASMEYNASIAAAGGAAGYVIWHEGDIRAFCVGESDPVNCGNSWYVMDWAGEFVLDGAMDTFDCDCGDDQFAECQSDQDCIDASGGFYSGAACDDKDMCQQCLVDSGTF